MNDRTENALLARRALAEKATPGPWLHCFIKRGEKCWAVDSEHNDILVHHPNSRSNIVHITANTPDVVKDDIDEILQLRSAVAQHEEYIGNLEHDAKILDRKIGELAEVLGIEHQTGWMMTPDAIKARVINLLDTVDLLENKDRSLDEILRLREENAKLKDDLAFANKVAAEQHEVAKLAWGGEVPSPLPGHHEATEEEAVAMCERLNCPWCGGSGHVGDCEDADQEVKTRLERLDREADWLAHICAEKMLDGVDEDSVNWWREKARDAAIRGRGDKSKKGE